MQKEWNKFHFSLKKLFFLLLADSCSTGLVFFFAPFSVLPTLSPITNNSIFKKIWTVESPIFQWFQPICMASGHLYKHWGDQFRPRFHITREYIRRQCTIILICAPVNTVWYEKIEPGKVFEGREQNSCKIHQRSERSLQRGRKGAKQQHFTLRQIVLLFAIYTNTFVDLDKYIFVNFDKYIEIYIEISIQRCRKGAKQQGFQLHLAPNSFFSFY